MGKVREAIDAGAGAGYIDNLERCRYLASQIGLLSERVAALDGYAAREGKPPAKQGEIPW